MDSSSKKSAAPAAKEVVIADPAAKEVVKAPAAKKEKVENDDDLNPAQYTENRRKFIQ